MLATELRMTRRLYESVKADLLRPHEFADERVGFLFGKYADGETPLVLINRYFAVEDDRYKPSEEFGALIDSDAILGVMQELRNLRGTGECAFHVHLHSHNGQPGLSRPDRQSLPKLIPGFQRMSPDGAHGILILSLDHGLAWTWTPGRREPAVARSICVAGSPTEMFKCQGGR